MKKPQKFDAIVVEAERRAHHAEVYGWGITRRFWKKMHWGNTEMYTYFQPGSPRPGTDSLVLGQAQSRLGLIPSSMRWVAYVRRGGEGAYTLDFLCYSSSLGGAKKEIERYWENLTGYEEQDVSLRADAKTGERT